MAHGRKVRAAHAEQMRARSSSREWMRLAVRAWREEVEHSKAMARERWKVRCVGDPPRRNRGESMQILGSADMLTGSRRGSVQRMEGGNRAGSSAGAAEDRTSDGQKQPQGHAGRRAAAGQPRTACERDDQASAKAVSESVVSRLRFNCLAVISLMRVTRTQKEQPKPTEGGKWRRLVERLMERGRGASEVTRDETRRRKRWRGAGPGGKGRRETITEKQGTM